MKLPLMLGLCLTLTAGGALANSPMPPPVPLSAPDKAPSAPAEPAPAQPPAAIDFEALEEVYGEPRVMIDLGGMLLKFMAAAAAAEDAEAAAILQSIDGVRINVYPTSGQREPAMQQINEARQALEQSQWQPVVQVREATENVQILMKTDGENMQGLTVMTVDGDEAVFINIVGEIDPTKLDVLMQQFDVDVEME